MARKTDSAKPAKPNARDGRYLAEAREAGVTWPAILAATGAASAIPLRVTLRAYLLSGKGAAKRFPREFAKVAKVPATPANAVALRDNAGAGFPLIAAKFGVSENEARSLYAEGGGLSADGRVYVGRAGRTLVLRPGESERIDRPAKKGKKGAKKGAKSAKRNGR